MPKQNLRKPLPPPFLPAPAELNKPRNQANAAKRAQRHADNEAEREPDKRLMNRTDLDVRARKMVTIKWIKNMHSAMHLWCEFMQEKLNSSAGPDYFRDYGPLPSRELLHQFFFWVSDTAKGNLYSSSHAPSEAASNEKVSVISVTTYSLRLFGAFSYYNKPLDLELRQNCTRWIKSNLASEIGLNRDRRQKPVGYSQDVEIILNAMWDYKALAATRSITAMFKTTLMINLLIDGASRCGEFIADTHNDDEYMYLKWSDLEFWALPSDDIDGVAIFINITSAWLKMHTFDGEFKSFVIHLLSPQFAFQDSCRLLVLLALKEGHFQDFRTWNQLMSCQPSVYGNPISIKQSSQNLPVFHPDCLRNKGLDPVEVPWTYYELLVSTEHLGRLAFLKNKVTLTALRRGDAYILDKYCKHRSTARTLMGQRTESRAFSTYLSKTATVDTQSLARNLPDLKNLTAFSGLSLGLCTEAPIALNQESLKALDTRPEYLEAVAAAQRAKQACIEKFGTLAEARRAAEHSHLFREYHRLASKKSDLWRRLAELEFRRFREAEINRLSAAKPAQPTASCENTGSDIPKSESHGGELVEGLDEEVASYQEPDVDAIIDDIGRLTADQTSRLAESFPESITGNRDPDDNEEFNYAVQDAHAEQYRLHHIYKLDLNAMVGRIGRMTTHLAHFSPQYVNIKDLYRSVVSNVDISSQEVADIILNLLSSERHAKRTPSHWDSPTGDYVCIVCAAPLETQSAYSHVFHCLQNAAKTSAAADWQLHLAAAPSECKWRPIGRKPCTVDISALSAEEKHAHTCKHTLSTGLACHWDGCNTRFSDAPSFRSHLLHMHNMMPAYSSECMNTWCRYCQETLSIPRYHRDRAAHFETHLDDAWKLTRDYGYAGVHIGQYRNNEIPQPFFPRQCVFCLHNEDLDAEQRLACKSLTHKNTDLSSHIAAHFRKVPTDDLMYCPGSAAGGALKPLCLHKQPMSRDGCWEHIQVTHYGFRFSESDAPGKPAYSTVKVHKRKAKMISVDAADIGDEQSTNVPGSTTGAPKLAWKERNGVRGNIKLKPKSVSQGVPQIQQTPAALQAASTNIVIRSRPSISAKDGHGGKLGAGTTGDVSVKAGDDAAFDISLIDPDLH